MECGRGLLSSFFNNTGPKKSECLSSVSGNGSKILEELITSWNGKDNVSVHIFSAEELIKATNNFDSGHMVLEDAFYSMYRGSAKKGPILIKKYGKEGCFWSSDDINSYAIRDIVITSQICSHKNALKFIGCCLELQFPALVYEYEGRIQLLSHGLHERDGGAVRNESLSWKSRLSIANDIASALVYLLTAFPTPIVHRNLKPSNFIIDQGGVAKLLDFSLSISIPPGESQVQDKVVGTYGFAEPEYTATGILTAKTDVYGFGKILLELLTGQRPVDVNRRGNHSLLDNCVKDYVDKDQLSKVVDPRIMAAGGGIEQDQQFRAFAALALRCTLENRENRPEMIDVAEELGRIQRAGGQGRVFCGQKYTRFMGYRRGMLSSILKKKKKHNLSSSDQERNFLENGSMLLEDLITFSNGKYNIPIRRFSVKELSRATNGFCSDQIVIQLDESHIYKGSFEERLIFIKKYDDCIFKHIAGKSVAIRDIVVAALMSSHKNALKLIGCCLDFEIPALVYECTGSIESLGDCLYERGGRGMAEESIGSLMWKSRLKIANDIAYAVVYMHTAFPTPIIHRDLKPRNIMIDQYGVAKLIDFLFSISLPSGETSVEDILCGTHGFVDPEYVVTSFVTEKSDVYSFGVILFELLTGKRAWDAELEENHETLIDFLKYYVYNDQFNKIVDPGILEGGGIAQEQLQAIAALTLRCIQENGEDRPEMIDVAKELRQILKSVCPSLSQP